MAEFPGGKVERGEVPAAAAIRECFEEAGLAVEVLDEYLATTHQYEHGLMELHFFRCQLVEESERLPRVPFRWVAASELAELEFPAANATLIERLVRTGNAVAKSS